MSIDLAAFTPWASLAGGALLGIAAALLLLFNGRIAGVSGILGGLLTAKPRDMGWRLAFLLGLVVSPWVYQFASTLPDSHIDTGAWTLTAAGLLVGVGTRYAGGCTSGHSVCGLSRLSLRSLVATLCFMAAGFITVFVARHLL